jgi:hypothetical protein
MAVTDRKVHREAKVALKHLVVPLITAVSQTAVKAFSFRPGYGFKVEGVQTYCLNRAGTVTADVRIGTQSVLASAAAFAAGNRVDAALAAGAPTGSATAELNVHYTTDGTGALTNGFVVVTIRPYPVNGDVA